MTRCAVRYGAFMSTGKLLALIVAFALALAAAVTAVSFVCNGWLAHLLVTADSVGKIAAITVGMAIPSALFGVIAAFAVQKPLDY